MQTELKRIQRRVGVTFLYVTHDQEEALTMSDRVAVMSRGRVEQFDTPLAVYHRPTSTFVADFIGEANLIPCRIAAVTPDEPRMLRRRATLALLDDRLPDARALLERALAKAPDDSATQAQLALACYRADAFKRASELYGEVGRAPLSAKLKSFGGLEPYRISGDTASVPFVHTDPLPLIQARVNGGEPNRYRSIQTFRLDQHAFAGGHRNLLANGRGLVCVCHRPDAFGGDDRTQPRDGLLQHSFFANDIKKLLRRAHAAARPEPRPAPSRKNNGVDCQLFFGLSHWQEKRI